MLHSIMATFSGECTAVRHMLTFQQVFAIVIGPYIINPPPDRPLEEHELIREVLSQWPSKQRPQLLLRTFLSKSMLWGPTPPVSGLIARVVLSRKWSNC